MPLQRADRHAVYLLGFIKKFLNFLEGRVGKDNILLTCIFGQVLRQIRDPLYIANGMDIRSFFLLSSSLSMIVLIWFR